MQGAIAATGDVERLLQDVQRHLEEIKKFCGDPEKAHSRRDDLWYLVLTTIADGCPGASLLAKEALKSEQIYFPRWYS